MSDRNGKVVLVAGGGRGIGSAICDRLHADGWTVVATSRAPDTASDLADRYGTTACVLDTTDPASALAAVEQVVEAHGRIDALVSNAGTNRPRPFLDVELDDWDAIFDVNVRGVFVLSQAVARHLVGAGRRGAIVTIGSQAGTVALEDRVPYCASKAAVDGMTRAMALDLAKHDITVNVVAPTFVRTEMTAATLDDPVRGAQYLARIPLGRFAEADDVSPLVAFLLSDDARMMTGQTVLVDGGWTMW